jgi:hypothetical protein
MQIAIAIFVAILGVGLFALIFRALRRAQQRLSELAEPSAETRLRPVSAGEPVRADGLLYLYAHDFVKPVPRRAMGSVPRDRAYACQTQDELDTEDFARQLLYAIFTELLEAGVLTTRLVRRDPTFMPPYPHKQWELQFRCEGPVPSSPLNESLAVAFELSRKSKPRDSEGAEPAPEAAYCSLEELLERMLKAIRQEMTFWERGNCCADLRRHVENALIAQGYLDAPTRDTWLDTVRRNRPTLNLEPVQALAPEAKALAQRLAAFRQRHGSAVALEPQQDERGQIVDIEPSLATHTGDLDDLPLDDCLRLTIHEAIAAIKQLEPSGEAGI